MTRPLLLFDFDGTLADTFHTSIRVFCAETGRPAPTDKEMTRLRGMPSREVIKAIGIRWWELPFVIRRVKRRMTEALHGVHSHKGIPAALKSLHKRYDIGVVTSNDEVAVRLFLERHNIPYDLLVGDVGLFGKARVLRRLARDRHVVAYVGDETRDIDAARKAGVRAVGVSWGYNTREALATAGADTVLTDAKALARL
jgi:phosphoglycolate phosphatase